jgi:hypothetical protein
MFLLRGVFLFGFGDVFMFFLIGLWGGKKGGVGEIIIIIHVGNKKLKPKLLQQMVGDHNKTSHIQSIA